MFDDDLFEKRKNKMNEVTCPDCQAKVGELHPDECDVARCGKCGSQLISCDCGQSENTIWTGDFPSPSKTRIVTIKIGGVEYRNYVGLLNVELPANFTEEELEEMEFLSPSFFEKLEVLGIDWDRFLRRNGRGCGLRWSNARHANRKTGSKRRRQFGDSEGCS